MVVSESELFDFDDGHVQLPGRPGLGLDIDERRVRELADDVDWHNPVWRGEDGAVTEW